MIIDEILLDWILLEVSLPHLNCMIFIAVCLLYFLYASLILNIIDIDTEYLFE